MRAKLNHPPDFTVRTLAVLPFKPLVTGNRNEYLELGLADALITKFSNLSRRRPLVLAALGQVYAASGKRAEAQQVLDQLQEMPKQRFVSPYHVAQIYTDLGEKEQALSGLRRRLKRAPSPQVPSSLTQHSTACAQTCGLRTYWGGLNLAP